MLFPFNLPQYNYQMRRPGSGEAAEDIPSHFRRGCHETESLAESLMLKANRGKRLADDPRGHRAEGCFIKALPICAETADSAAEGDGYKHRKGAPCSEIEQYYSIEEKHVAPAEAEHGSQGNEDERYKPPAAIKLTLLHLQRIKNELRDLRLFDVLCLYTLALYKLHRAHAECLGKSLYERNIRKALARLP